MAIPIKWQNHIEAWKQSGLKQSEYCRQNGLNKSTFGARLSDYQKQPKATLPGLIPVQVKTPSVGTIVFKHAKGHQVELPLSTSATWLGEFLKCLD